MPYSICNLLPYAEGYSLNTKTGSSRKVFTATSYLPLPERLTKQNSEMFMHAGFEIIEEKASNFCDLPKNVNNSLLTSSETD